MLDVVGLLGAPAPWEAHGAAAPLPPGLGAVLTLWDGTPADFFRTSGTVEEAIRLAAIKSPGLVFGDAAEEIALAPGTLAALQQTVTSLAGGTEARRLVLSGPILWDGTLTADDLTGVTLDFTAARVDLAQAEQPLIRLTRSRKVLIRGLRVGQRNAAVLDVTSTQDLAITDCAMAGATEAAILLSGGCLGVLIDRSAFLRNMGPAVRARGEVSNLVISRSAFDGPSRSAYLDLTSALSARGFAAPTPGTPSRDALTWMYPTGVRVLENRFGALDQVAIMAMGTLGLWVERNDFVGAANGALVLRGPAIGLMLADNRIQSPSDSNVALLSLTDVAMACIFRNIFEQKGQVALQVQGSFGGLLVAANMLLIDPGAETAGAPAALRLEPAGMSCFLSATIMLNTIRGPFASGILVTGELPRLFLFDNHLFGMSNWSLEARLPQPMATSMNNWSPVKSLNLPLSEAMIEVARMIRSDS